MHFCCLFRTKVQITKWYFALLLPNLNKNMEMSSANNKVVKCTFVFVQINLNKSANNKFVDLPKELKS